ncbi:MAG: hypothetical protein M3P18_18005 [Actinomycetota bacterium]|nr:hypothetical protein [Actinomycetota bacterium]
MALYPGVRCKILYQRDYLNLLIKYGLEEPSQGPLLVPTPAGSPTGPGLEQMLSTSSPSA